MIFIAVDPVAQAATVWTALFPQLSLVVFGYVSLFGPDFCTTFDVLYRDRYPRRDRSRDEPRHWEEEEGTHRRRGRSHRESFEGIFDDNSLV